MKFNEYQELSSRTAGKFDTTEQEIAVWGLGISGEAGEVAELIKKYLGHGHPLDLQKLSKELGDVLWYISQLATELGLSLDEIAQGNINKLKARYPEGFSSQASMNRSDNDE